MRVKLTIFILSVFLLWSSLLAASHHNNLSKRQETKISAEIFGKSIASDEDLIWKKSSDQFHSLLIKFAKAKINAGSERLNTTSRFTQKSVKFYLLFRVLRN
jgi:hypothetical protein